VSKFIAANDRALCRCGIRIPSARNRCPAFDNDKYLKQMIGDVGNARTNAAMLLLPIDTTSSHTCIKPIVGCSASFVNQVFLQSTPARDFASKLFCLTSYIGD